MNFLLDQLLCVPNDSSKLLTLSDLVVAEGLHDILLFNSRFEEEFVESANLGELLEGTCLLLSDLLQTQSNRGLSNVFCLGFLDLLDVPKSFC